MRDVCRLIDITPLRDDPRLAATGASEDALMDAVTRLPVDEQVAVLLHREAHLTFAAIGRLLDRTPAEAKRLYQAAVEFVSLQLGD